MNETGTSLASEDGYVGHDPEPKERDNAPESGFTEYFGKLKTE
ncbi:hypothetical protein [Deinococcus sp. UYEF24]